MILIISGNTCLISCFLDPGNCDNDRYGGDAAQKRHIDYCDNVGYVDDWERHGLSREYTNPGLILDDGATGKWLDGDGNVHIGRVRIPGV